LGIHDLKPSIKFLLAAVAAVAMLLPAVARDNGQWSNSPAAIRWWFQSLMEPDNPAVSCCGEPDAFVADTFEVEGDHYVAIITGRKGTLPEDTRVAVPNGKMKWDARQPDRPRHHLHRHQRPVLLLRRARRRVVCP